MEGMGLADSIVLRPYNQPNAAMPFAGRAERYKRYGDRQIYAQIRRKEVHEHSSGSDQIKDRTFLCNFTRWPGQYDNLAGQIVWPGEKYTVSTKLQVRPVMSKLGFIFNI